MDQLLVVGRKSIARDLLVSLQSLGVVQIVPVHGEVMSRFELQGGERKAKEAWDAVVAKSEGLIETLSAWDVPPASKERLGSLSELQSYLGDLGSQVDSLVAERSEIDDELDLIGAYLPLFRELAPTLAQLEGSRYLYGAAFIVPGEDALGRLRAALDEALPERYELSTRPYGNRELLAVVATLQGDRAALQGALSRAGLSELRLPERYSSYGVAKAVHVMEERSQALPKRRKTLQEDLAHLAKVHGGRLHLIHEVALNHQARYAVMEDLAAGRYSFALQGWVPASERRRVVSALEKGFGGDVVIEARKADEHHDHEIPVKLENPGWVKPFEGLLSLFNPPKYGYFDPSWTLAVFFPLFFGLVVGDIGFGLLFLALGLWLRARGKQGKPLSLGPLGITVSPGALPAIGTVINWCAFWSIVWGFLYGEFFGNFLERWYGIGGKPVFYPTSHYPEGYGWIPIVLFRVEEYMPLLLLSIGFGVFQVLFGWAIRAYYGLRHRDMKHFWEGVGMFSGLAAVVVFAYAFLTDNLVGNAFVLFFVALGFAIFILGVVFSKLPLMLVELISNSGNILSYLRLFAVGLSAALVANLATNLGFELGGVAPIIGPILGILVALAVHLIAIALTIIGHTLQPLRLHYVEFFTKFGFYEENGTPYRPFRLLGGKA